MHFQNTMENSFLTENTFIDIDSSIDDYDDSIDDIHESCHFVACHYHESDPCEVNIVSKFPNTVFYRYGSDTLVEYIESYDSWMGETVCLEIAKIYENDTDDISQLYTVVLKTFWIRLIQKAWKRACLHKRKIIIKNANPFALRDREIYGRFPHNIPTKMLRGLLVK
jgi:hypothetical protein